MAENVHSALHDLLICSFCLEDTSNPKTLNCQHTFCCECLRKYISTKDDKNKVECPTCRQWSPIPNGDLDNMKANFLFQQLKDITNTNKISPREDDKTENTDNNEPICSNPDCKNKAAVRLCRSCSYICVDCEGLHKSVAFLRNHRLISLSEATQTRCHALLPCLQHEDQLLQLFCETCNIPICSMCYPLYHSQHTCEELKAKAEKTKSQLIDMMEKTKKKIVKVKDAGEQIKEHANKIEENVTNVKQVVSTAFMKIQEELKHQEEKIYLEIDTASQQANKALEGERNKVDIDQATLSSVMFCGEKLIEHGKPSDYLMTVPLLVKQLTDHTPDYYDEEDWVNSLPDVNLTDLRSNVEAMKSYGEIERNQKQTSVEKRRLEDDVREMRSRIAGHESEKEQMLSRYRVIERNLLMKSNALAQESQEKGNIEEEVKVLTSRITKLQSENQQMFTEYYIIKRQLQWKSDRLAQQSEQKRKIENEARQMQIKMTNSATQCAQIYRTAQSLQEELKQKQFSLNLLTGVYDKDKNELPQPPGGTLTLPEQRLSDGGKIRCVFSGGIQSSAHPRPGKVYSGATLEGNLPNTDRQDIARLLKKAFDARVLVTVKNDKICWNGVNIVGGTGGQLSYIYSSGNEIRQQLFDLFGIK